LIVDFIELDHKKYQSFIQENSIQDCLVLLDDVIEQKLTCKFQLPNSGQVRSVNEERWQPLCRADQI